MKFSSSALILLLLAAATSSAQTLTTATLVAARPGGFAAHPWLDAGVDVTLEEAATVDVELRITMESLIGQSAPTEWAARRFTRTLPAGRHRALLSDDGRYFWNFGMGNSRSYRLAGTVSVGDESLSLGTIGVLPWELKESKHISPNAPLPKMTGDMGRMRLGVSPEARLTSEPVVLLSPGNGPIRHRYTLRNAALRAGAIEADVYTMGNWGTPSETVTTTGLSAGNAADMVWLKTLEWRFNSSPYSTGWDATPFDSEGLKIVPWYDTDATAKLADRIDMFERSTQLPHRIHRLSIETTGTGTGVGGWRITNLFRNPESDDERREPGKNHPEKAYDFTSRLLRFDVILSSSVAGDSIPPIRFTVEGDAFVYTEELTQLFTDSGATAEAGEYVRHSFLVQPPHYLEGVSKRLDFAFEVVGSGAAGGVVNLENLAVWETPIADLPALAPKPGIPLPGDANIYIEPWPEVSMMRESADQETVTIKPTIPDCESDVAEDGRYFFADHATFLDDENRWHLYGIYNTRIPFTPLDAEGNPLPNGPFRAGLIHAEACTPGAPIDALRPNAPGIAAWRGASFLGPERRTRDVLVDPDMPSYFFGPWAPTVIKDRGEFLMFYTENNLDNPARMEGFRYASSTTPGDPASWTPWQPKAGERIVYTLPERDRPRDLTIAKRHSDARDTFYAAWAGYKPELPEGADKAAGKVLVKAVENDPRLFHTVPASEEYTVYDLHQSDSGRIDSECESPTLLYDETTDLFYLKVTKNGTSYPGHAFDNDVLALDAKNGTITLGERTRGDRSVLIPREDDELSFAQPIAMESMEHFPRWNTAIQQSGTITFQYRVALLDAGDADHPPALIRVDCVNGAREFFGIGNREESPLKAPTDLERVAYLRQDDGQSMGFLISDEGGIFLAEEDLETRSMTAPRRIVSGLEKPRAMHLSKLGTVPSSALVRSADGKPLVELKATMPGIRATEFGGAIMVGIQQPEQPNNPLSVSPYYGSYYPNLHVSIMLATDDKGNPVSTAAEVAKALQQSTGASHHVRALPVGGAGADLVPPQALELTGGADRRTLFFVDESGSPGMPSVYTIDLSNVDRPGKPRIAVTSTIEWDPVSLVVRDVALFILDAKRNAIFRVDVTRPAAIVDESGIFMRSMPGAAHSISRVKMAHWDDLLVSGDGFVGRLDPDSGALDTWLSQGMGYGTELGSLVSAIPVYWNLEGIDAGAKIYWSQVDQTTGRLRPFTADRYIGYLPYGASELHADPNQENSPWYTTFNESSRSGGYGIRRVEWMPPLGHNGKQ